MVQPITKTPFPEGISGFDDDGRSQLFYIKLGQSHLWKHVTEACLRIERCRAAVARISSREDDDSRNGVFILSGSTGNKGHESFWSCLAVSSIAVPGL